MVATKLGMPERRRQIQPLLRQARQMTYETSGAIRRGPREGETEKCFKQTKMRTTDI